MKKKFFVALLCTAMMACSMTVYAEPGDPAQQEEEILVENTAPEQEEEVPAKDTSPEQEEEVPAENTSSEQEEEVSVEETSPELDDVIEALYSSPQGITKVSGKVGEDFTFNDITAVPTFTSEWTEAEIIASFFGQLYILGYHIHNVIGCPYLLHYRIRIIHRIHPLYILFQPFGINNSSNLDMAKWSVIPAI